MNRVLRQKLTDILAGRGKGEGRGTSIFLPSASLKSTAGIVPGAHLCEIESAAPTSMALIYRWRGKHTLDRVPGSR